MSPDVLRHTLDAIRQRLSSRSFDVRNLVFEPPASPADVDALERKLNLQLPPTLRKLLQEYSRHVQFRWFAPEGTDFPEPFRSNFCGDLHWSVSFTEQFDSAKNEWISKVFSDPSDSYSVVWHNKLAFYEVGNGDYLSIDLSPDGYEQIVYLSHDDGEGHGHVLAANVLDLLDRWVPVACTGGEDWQWLAFTQNKASPIDPTGDAAKKWRWILGIPD